MEQKKSRNYVSALFKFINLNLNYGVIILKTVALAKALSAIVLAF